MDEIIPPIGSTTHAAKVIIRINPGVDKTLCICNGRSSHDAENKAQVKLEEWLKTKEFEDLI